MKAEGPENLSTVKVLMKIKDLHHNILHVNEVLVVSEVRGFPDIYTCQCEKPKADIFSYFHFTLLVDNMTVDIPSYVL